MKYLCFLISVMFLTSCPAKYDEIETTCDVNFPLEDLAWLNKIKVSFEQSTSVSKKQIIQYDYKNETTFLIDICNGCADSLTTLYNCKGEKICEFGGIAGLNTCPDFEKEATNKIILWEN